MNISEQLKDEILRNNILDLSGGIHGYIVLVDGNKIWKNDNNVFLFCTRKQAMTAFYNTMKWKVGGNLRRAEGVAGWSYGEDRDTWNSFKRACHFEIKQL